MANLVIPETYRAGLSAIRDLSVDEARRVIETLSALELSSDHDELASLVARQHGGDARFFEVARATLSLYNLRANPSQSLEKVVSEITEEMQRVGDEPLRVRSDQAEQYKERLRALLGNEKIARYFRALLLGRDGQCNFLDARIITDVRPIFESDRIDAPTGAVIIHTLRLDYWQDSGSKELYLLIDAQDIAKLKAALDRATEKAQALTKFIRTAQTELLDVK